MKWVFRIVGILVAILAVLALAGWLLLTSILNRLGGNPEDAIVHILEDVDLTAGEHGLILRDFVTGAGPRLITGNAALAAMEDRLWYSNPLNVGTVSAQAMFSLMGMPMEQDIGSLVRDGTTLRIFRCMSVNCINWPTHEAPEQVWGLGDIRSQDDIPSRPVRFSAQHFDQYEPYIAAHGAALADPAKIFAEVDGDVAKPPDDGMRYMTIMLPTLISPAPPAEPDETAQSELRDMAENWSAGFDASITYLEASPALPFWLFHNGEIVYDDVGFAAVTDISYISRQVTFQLRAEEADAFAAHLSRQDFPPPDLDQVTAAIARTFEEQGLDTTCLPACGGVDEAIMVNSVSVSKQPDPSWSLDVWEIEQGEPMGNQPET